MNQTNQSLTSTSSDSVVNNNNNNNNNNVDKGYESSFSHSTYSSV
jgi:hypothetical protein